ncbi:MAG TPA: hypothetical protein VLK33_09260 [Terriglobales bacterium]|nr:hypothetical protein [Terriglobales bacterium]
MKTVLFLFSMFCATGALAQSGGVLSNEVQKWDIPSHPNHASVTPLAQEQNLTNFSSPTVARGERPLWEVGQIKEEPSLGEVARAQRKMHAADKKSPVVWHN